MTSPLSKLDAHLAMLERKPSWTTADLNALFSYTRQLLESAGELDRYPTVRFYCNWMLHSFLNREREPIDRLIQWSMETADVVNGRSSEQRIVNFFSSGPLLMDLNGLHSQLDNVIKRVRPGAFARLATIPKLEEFTALIAEELANKPVGFHPDFLSDPYTMKRPKWQREAFQRLHAIEFQKQLSSKPLFVSMEVKVHERFGNGPIVLVSNREALLRQGPGLSVALPVFPHKFVAAKNGTTHER